MRIIVAASGEFAVPLLRSLVRAGYEIPFVLTQPDRQAGRGKRVRPTPVRQAADELNLEVIATPDVNSPDTIDLVASSGARLGLAVAFGQKIGPALLTSLPAGWLNAHASLLPAYRGAAPDSASHPRRLRNHRRHGLSPDRADGRGADRPVPPHGDQAGRDGR